jgi:hypothetical protein
VRRHLRSVSVGLLPETAVSAFAHLRIDARRREYLITTYAREALVRRTASPSILAVQHCGIRVVSRRLSPAHDLRGSLQ